MVRKLKSRSGLTLAETLVAVLILLLVSTIVARGVPVAKNAYEKVVVAANAKVMLTNAIAALRNELALAQRITVDPATKSITYYSADRGADSKIYIFSGTGDDSDYMNGTIMLQEYKDYENSEVDPSFFGIINPSWEGAEGVTVPPRELIASLEAQRGLKNKLYVCCSGFTYSPEDRTVKVSGLKVCYSINNSVRVLAQIGDAEPGGDLIIRVIPNDAIFVGT